MANIKISELEEYTQAKDNDLLVIVDTTNNETKKIKNSNLSKNKLDKTSIKNIKTDSDENIYSCNYVNTAIGSLEDLETTDKTNIVNAINGVVESGSNANGSYVKYADGTMVCYGTWNIGNVAFSSAVGSVYNAPINLRRTFPVPFINKPVMTFSAYENVESYGLFLQVCPKRDSVTSQDFGSLNVMSITQVSAHLAIDYIAIGKWK